MDKLNINQWAEEDRPREKLMRLGADALSNAELMAILIGSGNTKENAVDLMKKSLERLQQQPEHTGKDEHTGPLPIQWYWRGKGHYHPCSM